MVRGSTRSANTHRNYNLESSMDEPSPPPRRGPGRPRGIGRGQNRGQRGHSSTRDPAGRNGTPTAIRGGHSRRVHKDLHPSPPSTPPRDQGHEQHSLPLTSKP